MIVPIVGAADSACTALFNEVFALYERMFPKNERHSYATLIGNLRRNDPENPRTLWLAAKEGNNVMGGVCAYVASGGQDADILLTMAYIFVAPQARGRGLARQLEQALVDYVAMPRVLIVCDVEDPAKMAANGVTKAQYDEAAKLYGITPFERLVFWRDRMGYRGTDFPYTLCVSRPGAQETKILTLHARYIENGIDRTPEKISSATLREAAAFINCECPYAEIPASYRNNPALQTMWSWPDSNAYARVSPHRADEFDHLKDHWK